MWRSCLLHGAGAAGLAAIVLVAEERAMNRSYGVIGFYAGMIAFASALSYDLVQILQIVVTPLISIVYFHPNFSQKLLFLGFPRAVTAPLFMVMLAIVLRKRAAE